MRKIIISGMLLMLVVLMSSLVNAQYTGSGSGNPDLFVALISQEPDPVEPGEVVKLRFKIENNGSQSADDVKVELLPEFPFSMYSGSAVVDVGKLRAGQTGADAIIVEYRVQVDEAAIEGDEEIDLQILIRGAYEVFEDFQIRIRTRDAVLSVAAVESVPEVIAPGEEVEVALTLRNDADSLLRDIHVELDLTGDVPFAPSKATAEEQIYQLPSNMGKVVKFSLVALPDATGGIFKIPINLSFADETGEEFSKDDIISLKVSSPPDLLANIDGFEAERQQPGDLSIRITNRGLTDIKLASAKLGEVKGVDILSEPEVYVGNIDSDDFEVAEFKIQVKSFAKIVELPIEVRYRDATNEQHVQDFVLELRTGSRGIVLTILSSLARTVIILVILSAIAYGGYWFYKRKKKKG